jgi:hypothetical protein
MDDKSRDYLDYMTGVIRPGPQCELPEPIRPEGDAGIMVVATCPHCNIDFLLVNMLDGEEWIQKQHWWNYCDEQESRHRVGYYPREPRMGNYLQKPHIEYEVDYTVLKRIRVEDNYFTDCTFEEE